MNDQGPTSQQDDKAAPFNLLFSVLLQALFSISHLKAIQFLACSSISLLVNVLNSSVWNTEVWGNPKPDSVAEGVSWDELKWKGCIHCCSHLRWLLKDVVYIMEMHTLRVCRSNVWSFFSAKSAHKVSKSFFKHLWPGLLGMDKWMNSSSGATIQNGLR